MSEQSHKMQLETTYPSGAEEWLCPECKRRFVAQWEPKFRRIILEQGDERAVHTGQNPSPQDLNLEIVSEDIVADDIQLSDIWKELLDKLDFDPDEANDQDE